MDNSVARLDALLARARILSDVGAVDESRAAFHRALALSRERREASREGHARCGLARLDAIMGRWEAAVVGFKHAKICAAQARDEGLMQLALASESFHGSELQDAQEQLTLLVHATAHFRAVGRERESIFWRAQLARAYTDYDRSAEAHACASDALARARALGDRATEGFASFAMGCVLLGRNDPESAAAACRDAVEGLGHAGRKRDYGLALGYLGLAEHLRERFADAEARYAEAIDVLSAARDLPNAVLFRLLLAGALADQDRTAEAQSRLEVTRAEAESWAGSGMRSIVGALCGSLLDASLARDARREEDLAGFVAHRRTLSRGLQCAEVRPETIESARRDYTWLDVSLEVRVAYRLAKRALCALERVRLPRRCMMVEGRCARVRARSDSEWIDLRTRRRMRHILERLVMEHETSPGAAVSLSGLVEAAWPGSRPDTPAARNRLHVALATLRRLGLGASIEHVRGGWRLRAGVRVVRVQPDQGASAAPLTERPAA